ncbi:hypothetical protein C5167_041055 [Papaver somniferum]|uniref:Dirigent protein n=1 Tax=Papaver somniferum TaxID=3469 RepID=A0A4Y7IGT5_PAPSO|nr:hypothetical protein C5167_041055 [Papaver somniferum]
MAKSSSTRSAFVFVSMIFAFVGMVAAQDGMAPSPAPSMDTGSAYGLQLSNVGVLADFTLYEHHISGKNMAALYEIQSSNQITC